MKRIIFLLLLGLVQQMAFGQRVMDRVDRGLVAVPAASGNFVSWRVLAEEYYDVTYNLYCNGTLLKKGLKVSNFTHSAGNTKSEYQVAAVVRGIEQDKCAAVKCWTSNSLRIPVQPITGRDGKDVTSNYILNEVSMGDLDGDGMVEFIVKRQCSVANDPSQKNCFHILDAYDRTGKQLWWIDLGPNMISAGDEQWDCICYDWDEDGKAEVLLRIQDNAYIHFADGTKELIGQANVDTRWSGMEYTASGNEYLLYLEGATGRPYSIGPSSHPHYIDYPNPRGQDSDWGTGIAGHRSTKHYFAAPYLDGRHASIFLGRGCYTKHLMKAFDVDPSTHKLTQRWAWECNVGGIWFGQGYHNFCVADVDWDGRDEIVFGSMVIDDNGRGLSSCGLGHGDAQHCADFDPYRHGQEQYCCNESAPNCNYRNATTSQFYYRNVGTSDDGRALMGNFTNDIPGSQGSTVGTGWLASCADKIIPGVDYIGWADLNQRVYWDGDLLDEYFDSPGTERAGVVYKVGGGRWDLTDSHCINWTKNNPSGIGDIIGDWREEIIMRDGNDQALLVFTTNIPTNYRIPTLWSDHQYRNAMVTQPIGYNQPPHKSYFLGELEGITQAPPPLTMTGRTEVKSGGTITTTDDHLIVCATANTNIKIQSGASPYMVTFNVPSWVQGNAGNNATSNPAITYKYFTCNVTGGALTGSTRVVKQGDGILNLPKVNMTYTGETDIWAGTLNFDGSLLNSPLWLNRFTQLNSNGGKFRSIKADYASVICPGGADVRGVMTVDTLLLRFGSRVQFDVYSNTIQSDMISTRRIEVERKTGTAWEQYGPRLLTPVFEFVTHLSDGDTKLASGRYVLGTAGEVIGLDNIKIEGISGQRATLSVDDGRLILSIEDLRTPSTVYWTGNAGDVWDFAKTANFDNEGQADYFVGGDRVVFDDASSGATVTLQGELDPSEVVVEGSKSFIFKGTGALVGNASLVKEGKGTLTIDNDNTFSGKVRISGGTLKVSTLSNATLSYGNLGAVSTDNQHIIIENGATLQSTADVTTSTPIRLASDRGGAVSNSSAFVMNSYFVGTKLTKRGNGRMTLYNNSASLDTLVVVSGSVAASCETPARYVELQGGGIDMYVSNSTPVCVPKGKTASLVYVADRGVYSNRLTGGGTVSITYPVVVGSGWYADRCSVTGDWSDFTGTIKPVCSAVDDGRFCLNNSFGLPNATMEIASGVNVQNTGREFAIGLLTGKGTIGYISTLGGNVGTMNTWTIGNNDRNFTFEGLITGPSSIVKRGTCKMTHKGKGDYTGTTKISEGEMCLSNPGNGPMLGTGNLTVARGATLSGNGVLGNALLTVSTGGVLRSGITETNPKGQLEFSGKNVTVNGTIQSCISSAHVYGKFTDIAALKITGTICLKGSQNLALPVGTEVKLFDANKITLGSNLKFDLCSPDPSKNLTWDTSRLASEGVIVVVEGTTDAIDGILSSKSDDTDVYTLSGQRVDRRSANHGIFVTNGKKVLVK